MIIFSVSSLLIFFILLISCFILSIHFLKKLFIFTFYFLLSIIFHIFLFFRQVYSQFACHKIYFTIGILTSSPAFISHSPALCRQHLSVLLFISSYKSSILPSVFYWPHFIGCILGKAF